MTQPETSNSKKAPLVSCADTADEKIGNTTNTDPVITTIGAGQITGTHLRNVRIAKGTSIEEVCDRTKIRRQYLLAIEEGNEKKYPPQVFLKGYVKAYASAIGLDPNVIARKFILKTEDEEMADENS